ncbi:MAG: AAA family ATPase [Anaerolineales bacterium]
MLGPPQITWHGETYNLPRRQARALLYYLANAFAPVSRDKLLYLFWPDEPETKARRNLTRLVSYLRQELPHPEILLVTRENLQVNPDRVWVDIERFSQLCAENSTWEEAVSLYQGPFAMGFSLGRNPEYDFWLTEEQGRYEAMYLKTLAELVQVKKQRGAYADAIQYAQQYLVVDELAEEIHRHLITLFAAQGNRKAALKQYETCVQVLERELGVSPLPDTRNAYESAWKGGRIPAQASIKPSWTILPSMHLPMIGREDAWEALESAYLRLHTGGIILISGEAGVGKSRLMQEFATEGERIILTGNNHLSTQKLPYHALVQALRQMVPHPQLWTSIAPIWLGELTRLLPELHDDFPDLPQPLDVEPEQAQARLFEALSQVFLGLAAQASSVLLCLDDLHWADEATLGWLNAISSRLSGSKVCILGTYRQEEGASLRDMLRTFRREGLFAEVVLKGLSPLAICEILEQIPGNGATQAQLANRLHQATGGNAFFVLETVRALLESEQLEAPPEVMPLPKTVQQTIHSRLARLTPLARQLLDAAAVLSPELEIPLLWQTAGRTELEAADGLDELVQRQILGERAGALEFRHELLRTTAYDALNPWRKKLLHRRAGDALRAIYASTQDAVAAQMALHYDAAGAYEQAVKSYEMAASAAKDVYAHEEAIGHLRRAIALLPEIDVDPMLPARLYEMLGVNLVNAGRFEMARKAYNQAISTLSIESTMSLAQLNWRLAKTHIAQLHYKEVEIHLDRALTALGEPLEQRDEAWWRLWLDIQMDQLTFFAYLLDAARFDALSKEIAPVIENYGTLEQHISYRSELYFIDLVKNRYRPSTETFVLLDRYLDLVYASRNPRRVTFAQFSQGYCMLHAGDLEGAEELFLKSLNQARQFDIRVHEARCLSFLSTVYRRLGEMDRTAEFSQVAEEKGAEVGSRHYIAHSLANSAWLAYHSGEMDLALEKAEKASQDFVDTKVPFAWLTCIIMLAIYTEAMNYDQAIKAAETMLDPMQQRLPDNLTAALEGAVRSWIDLDIEKCGEFLEEAIQLARERGYL